MSRYIRIAERRAIEARERIRAGLQQIADDPSAKTEQKLEALSRLSELEIQEQRVASKVGPLQETIDSQAKELRSLRAQFATANEQLQIAQSRIAELESQKQDIESERDGVKADLVKASAALSLSRTATAEAEKCTAKAKKQVEEARARLDQLKLNFQTFLSQVRRTYAVTLDDSFATKLFFSVGDDATFEMFAMLGWSEERFTDWTRARNAAKTMTSERLIEFVHAANGCALQCHKPNELSRQVAEGILRHRNIDVAAEVTKLKEEHLQLYRQRNPVPLFGEPPLQYRQITPLLPRIARWGED